MHTFFWIDPKEQLISMVWTQMIPWGIRDLPPVAAFSSGFHCRLTALTNLYVETAVTEILMRLAISSDSYVVNVIT